MMLTGRQIREARALLGVSSYKVAITTKVVTTQTVHRAEADDHRPPIADHHMRAIRQALETLGVEFTANGPQLRKNDP